MTIVLECCLSPKDRHNLRLRVDSHQFNTIAIQDAHTLPRIEENLDSAWQKIFSLTGRYEIRASPDPNMFEPNARNTYCLSLRVCLTQ